MILRFEDSFNYSDLSHNEIKGLNDPMGNNQPFKNLEKLHDLHLGFNHITAIENQDFNGLSQLKVL